LPEPTAAAFACLSYFLYGSVTHSGSLTAKLAQAKIKYRKIKRQLFFSWFYSALINFRQLNTLLSSTARKLRSFFVPRQKKTMPEQQALRQPAPERFDFERVTVIFS
jgi:hypothetical protein